MDRIVIKGGRGLRGEIPISGAKNACLPIMTASLLTDETCTLRGVPQLMDVRTMARLLAHLGVEVGPEMARAETVSLRDGNPATVEAPYELVKTMRASVLVLGPLVARHRKARVSLPGGCAIGARPINLHLKGLAAMGARIELEGGYVEASARRLEGTDFTFDQVTVTGTENLVMAAVLARGRTVLRNAAREPEVGDLCRTLLKMGARIEGLDTATLTIDGVDDLGGFDHRVMPDRIETGTYLAAAAITGSDLTLTGARPETLDAVTAKLREAGAKIETGPDRLRIRALGSPLRAVDCATAPYPGFPTDMQAQLMAALAVARGTSVIKESIFENRFMHVQELARLGADIRVDGNEAVVRGVDHLSGAPVMATDLRASACLIVAGLAARGETVIRRVYHLDRGYEKIVRKLSAAGAEIWREKDE